MAHNIRGKLPNQRAQEPTGSPIGLLGESAEEPGRGSNISFLECCLLKAASENRVVLD
ncbi:MAG: hypothetical protein R3B96_01595 [Pirellulaceae bacterium]